MTVFVVVVLSVVVLALIGLATSLRIVQQYGEGQYSETDWARVSPVRVMSDLDSQGVSDWFRHIVNGSVEQHVLGCAADALRGGVR